MAVGDKSGIMTGSEWQVNSENGIWRTVEKAILSASSSAEVHVFEKTRQFRKDCISNKRNRPLLTQAIPMFDSLIEDDRDDKYHPTMPNWLLS